MRMHEAIGRVKALVNIYAFCAGAEPTPEDQKALAIVTAAAEKEIPYRPKEVNFAGVKAYECKCGNMIYTKVNMRCHYCGQALKW